MADDAQTRTRPGIEGTGQEDAGDDAGTIAGTDGGQESGSEAGPDAGTEGGTTYSLPDGGTITLPPIDTTSVVPPSDGPTISRGDVPELPGTETADEPHNPEDPFEPDPIDRRARFHERPLPNEGEGEGGEGDVEPVP